MHQKSDAPEHARESLEESAEHVVERRFRTRAGVLLTVVAATLAVIALLVQRGLKNEIVNNIQLSGTRSSLETAQLLQADNQRSAQELTALASDSALSDTERSTLMSDAQSDESAAASEADNPQAGTGAKELSARLDDQESSVQAGETQVERLEYGEVLLEVALVLGSLGVVASSYRLLGGTALLGGVGLIVAVFALVA